jgi:hypothetical protein
MPEAEERAARRHGAAGEAGSGRSLVGHVVAGAGNALALRAHQSAKVRGLRPSNCRTVSVRNPTVSARMSLNPSMMASASAGGAPSG